MTRTMLVLGDSILWGQGLREADKPTTLLKTEWERRTGDTVAVHRLAHSGADIWDDGQSGLIAALDPTPPAFAAQFELGDPAIRQTRACEPTPGARDDRGEIPDEEPYLLRQILDAEQWFRGHPPDLIVLDGGINDCEVYNLVLPGKRSPAVVRRAASLRPRLEFALRRLAAAFPHARVLVTGYYPVVSHESRACELLKVIRRVLRLALETGASHPAGPFAGELCDLLIARTGSQRIADLKAPLVLVRPLRQLVTRGVAWTAAVHRVAAACVHAYDRGRGLAAFVDPAFEPRHAAFARDSLLWSFVDGEPQDPMAAHRRRWCREFGVHGFDRLIVECASMGHPNPAGARRYADRMIAAAHAIGVF